jgi:hypothetical protein
MQTVKIAIGIAVLGLVTIAGWQVGTCELANMELRDDMQDLASQLGTHIGLASSRSDEDLRNAVLNRAKRYKIELMPDQVIVLRTDSGATGTIYLAVDYTVPIHLPGFFFTIHFTPASGNPPASPAGAILPIISLARQCFGSERQTVA